MSLLRFDPSGSFESDFDAATPPANELKAKLLELRDELVYRNAPADGFFALPDRTLADYEADRQGSELGRIFRVANGMHDDIDAVVVIGSTTACAGIRALMDGCCEPFHNELSRGARGSKPRMYFVGDQFDNDASTAVLRRLAQGGYGDTVAESQYAMIAIGDCDDDLSSAVAVRQFLSSLECSLAINDGQSLQRMLIPVTREASRLRDLGVQIECQEIFTITEHVEGAFQVLSSTSLMPAAMLGLDCIKLLEGAASINRHFRESDFDNNLVLQFVANNHWLAIKSKPTRRAFQLWSNALGALGNWCEQLWCDSVDPNCSVSHSVNGLNDHQRRGLTNAGSMVTHVVVENDRSDRIGVGNSQRDQDGLNSIADHTLPELSAAAVEAVDHELHDAGVQTIKLTLPTIDTHSLGQLFQLMMIAATLERQLWASSDVCHEQPFHAKWRSRLGRRLGVRG